jgi:hypothetical protein
LENGPYSITYAERTGGNGSARVSRSENVGKMLQEPGEEPRKRGRRMSQI